MFIELTVVSQRQTDHSVRIETKRTINTDDISTIEKNLGDQGGTLIELISGRKFVVAEEYDEVINKLLADDRSSASNIRLISECYAVLATEQIKEMTESMSLHFTDVWEMLEHNEGKWDAIKDAVAAKQ